MAADCVGSGYCCAKAPCVAAMREHPELLGGPCPELEWNGERHLCGLLMNATEEKAKWLKEQLAIGAGCCSPLNSWRREPLKDRTRLPMVG
jgi:hypothetical protein